MPRDSNRSGIFRESFKNVRALITKRNVGLIYKGVIFFSFFYGEGRVNFPLPKKNEKKTNLI